MVIENQTILIVSNEPWSEMWYSKHNYAFELSKANTVYFINSPGKWKFNHLFNRKVSTNSVTPELTVLSLNNLIPTNFKILKELNNIVLSLRIKRFLKKRNHTKWLLWSFTPLLLFRPKLLSASFSIFHIVDLNWTTFYGGNIFARNADLLIFVSEDIKSEFNLINTPKFVIGHGISSDEFHLDQDKLEKTKSTLSHYGKFGLYVGAIDFRLDYKLIEKIVSHHSDVQFIFIGPLKLPKDHPGMEVIQGKHSNITLLGPKPFKELKYFIELSHFCLSPMDLTFSGNNISHHKTFSYLTQGKPIFGPVFTEYQDLNEILYQSNDIDEIQQYLSHFISNDEPQGLREKRIAHAKQFLYSSHLKKIENFINETYRSHNS